MMKECLLYKLVGFGRPGIAVNESLFQHVFTSKWVWAPHSILFFSYIYLIYIWRSACSTSWSDSEGWKSRLTRACSSTFSPQSERYIVSVYIYMYTYIYMSIYLAPLRWWRSACSTSWSDSDGRESRLTKVSFRMSLPQSERYIYMYVCICIYIYMYISISIYSYIYIFRVNLNRGQRESLSACPYLKVSGLSLYTHI